MIFLLVTSEKSWAFKSHLFLLNLPLNFSGIMPLPVVPVHLDQTEVAQLHQNDINLKLAEARQPQVDLVN